MSEEVRHQCLIYGGSPPDQLPRLAALAAQKLAAGHRCLFLNSPPMVAGFRSYLAATGIDVAGEVARGALVVTSDQRHLNSGRFEPDRMLSLLKEFLDQALKEGYAGLWATGDIMWELGSKPN